MQIPVREEVEEQPIAASISSSSSTTTAIIEANEKQDNKATSEVSKLVLPAFTIDLFGPFKGYAYHQYWWSIENVELHFEES